jgi:replicative DNA helicase
MQPIEFEKIVLKFMFQDESARDKILPFLDAKIFDDFHHKEIVKNILMFEQKQGKFPTIPDMKLCLDKEEVYNRLIEIINLDLTEYSFEPLMSEVEDFFKKKLIWNVTAEIADNLKEDKIGKISIAPEHLRQALAFSFKSNIGFNIFEDVNRFYDFIHNPDSVIPTGLDNLDRVIGGGVHAKTLTVFMAQANLGKTLLKCAIASNMLMRNKNILYITLEMSEEMIAERIYQNIFNFDKESLYVLTRDKFDMKVNSIKEKLKNSLYIREFPNKGANINTIKNLLKELEIKKKFKPDCIFIDYLGIMAPLYLLKSDNTYTEGKRVSEEVRGLAVESNVGIVSSIQSNRSSFDEVITSMSDMADSIGPAATSDVIVGISQTEEMRTAKKFSGIILKNRYGLNKIRMSFNVNYDKMSVTDESSKNEIPLSDANKIKEAIDLTTTQIKKESDSEKRKIIDFDPEE